MFAIGLLKGAIGMDAYRDSMSRLERPRFWGKQISYKLGEIDFAQEITGRSEWIHSPVSR